MLTEAFIERLQRPPIPKTRLRKAGYDHFFLARLSAFFQAVERRDPRVLKLVRALGLTPAEAFVVPMGKKPEKQTMDEYKAVPVEGAKPGVDFLWRYERVNNNPPAKPANKEK